MSSSRRDKLSRALRELLEELIRKEVKDPRVQRAGPFSINHVELNADNSVATAYLSFFTVSEEIANAAAEGLQSATRFLRGPVGKRLHAKRPPALRFRIDQSAEFRERLSAIVAEDASSAARAGSDEEE